MQRPGADTGAVRRHLVATSFRQMWRYRLRSALIIGCAALGVAGAVTAVNYASGGRQQVLEQIRRQGSNLIVVSALQSRASGGRARTGAIVTTLREEDHAAMRREVAGIARSSPVVTASLRLKAGDLSRVAPVFGVGADYFAIRSWRVAAGESFAPEDERRSSRVAVLGAQVARDLFGAASPLGERLFINRVPFEVVGVLAERGQGLDGVNEDQQVYVPLATAMRRLLNVDHYAAILVEASGWEHMDALARDITGLLRERHRVSDLRPEDFRVQSQKDLVDTQLASADRLTFLVRWVSLSGLLVSGLGILAIAWIAVRDRTREIGTRRAIGATAADVFFQFMFEAAVLAVIGVLVGLGAGVLATRVAASRAQLPFVFEAGNASLALAVALGLNLVFAGWPALRAARVDPVVALRHE